MTTRDNPDDIPLFLRAVLLDGANNTDASTAGKRIAFARALYAHIVAQGLQHDEMALDFVNSARNGHYWGTGTEAIPLGLKYINMTQEEFIAIRALIYE